MLNSWLYCIIVSSSLASSYVKRLTACLSKGRLWAGIILPVIGWWWLACYYFPELCFYVFYHWRACCYFRTFSESQWLNINKRSRQSQRIRSLPPLRIRLLALFAIMLIPGWTSPVIMANVNACNNPISLSLAGSNNASLGYFASLIPLMVSSFSQSIPSDFPNLLRPSYTTKPCLDTRFNIMILTKPPWINPIGHDNY